AANATGIAQQEMREATNRRNATRPVDADADAVLGILFSFLSPRRTALDYPVAPYSRARHPG
ncbi:MAG TPA: hypothetical protein VK652_07505, partial [Steroidobacteraceae bacterium]|nr:hypothetical protein [Steroidobacteraceae bacterium]